MEIRVMSLFLRSIFILSIGLLQAVDSSNIFHPVSQDITQKLFSAKIPAQEFLSKIPQSCVKQNSIDCPFDNGIHAANAHQLELHGSFFQDEACKKKLVKSVITFNIEPTSNKNITLLRSLDVVVNETSVNDQFFNNNLYTIPMLLFLAQEIETPFLLVYTVDPSNKNLRKPVLLEMPQWQKRIEYYDVYHNIGWFSFDPSARKQFAYQPVHFSPAAAKAMGLKPKSTLYANFDRIGVNRLISHYNSK
jgi:hypothetical protein